MVKRINILSAVFFLLFSFCAEAKTLYVAQTTGNDSVTYAENSSARPWATLGRAAWGSTNRSSPNASQAAQAGDTVLISEGTYNASSASGTRYIAAYNPANSGTAGSPITFKAVGLVTLQSTNGTGPVMGAYQKNYIIWDGFYIDEDNVITTADTGPVVVWYSDYCQIINCEIKGNNARWTGDNHNGIRVELTRNTVIRNNKIYGVHSSNGASGSNDSCIMVYDSSDLIIENNDLSDAGWVVYLKGYRNLGINNSGHIVRNNVFRDAGGALRMFVTWDAKIYHNIFRNISGAVVNIADYSPGYPRNLDIVNNTIYNSGYAFNPAISTNQTGIRIYNNIVFNSNRAIWSEQLTVANASNKSIIDFRHNNYYNSGLHAQIIGGNFSLSTWQSATGQDMVTPATLSTDPRFANVSQNDFRLAANSPCINAGIDILDLNRNGSTTDSISIGAYSTGNEVIGSSIDLISSPTGLTIR